MSCIHAGCDMLHALCAIACASTVAVVGRYPSHQRLRCDLFDHLGVHVLEAACSSFSLATGPPSWLMLGELPVSRRIRRVTVSFDVAAAKVAGMHLTKQ